MKVKSYTLSKAVVHTKESNLHAVDLTQNMKLHTTYVIITYTMEDGKTREAHAFTSHKKHLGRSYEDEANLTYTPKSGEESVNTICHTKVDLVTFLEAFDEYCEGLAKAMVAKQGGDIDLVKPSEIGAIDTKHGIAFNTDANGPGAAKIHCFPSGGTNTFALDGTQLSDLRSMARFKLTNGLEWDYGDGGVQEPLSWQSRNASFAKFAKNFEQYKQADWYVGVFSAPFRAELEKLVAAMPGVLSEHKKSESATKKSAGLSLASLQPTVVVGNVQDADDGIGFGDIFG